MRMSKKSSAVVDRAADFIWRNARMLERAIFARAFLEWLVRSGRRCACCLSQSDGGFGNALEADIRAPASTPLACECALRALHEADIRDRALASGMCEFLSSVAEPNGRVEIALPHILDYPRAAHWNSPSFGSDSPNPTAGIVGLLHYQGADHPWLTRASEWCWQRLERPLADAHEIATALRFLEYAPDRARAAKLAIRLAAEAPRSKWFLERAGTLRLRRDAAGTLPDAHIDRASSFFRRSDRRAPRRSGVPPTTRRRMADYVASARTRRGNRMARPHDTRGAPLPPRLRPHLRHRFAFRSPELKTFHVKRLPLDPEK